MTARPNPRDERGAALVLVIAFMVVMGLLTTALLSSLISAVDDRAVLDTVRDRQYAADATVEQAIARVRSIGGDGPAKASCGGPDTLTLNNVPIRVDCANARTLTFSAFEQRNVIFTACVDAHIACTNSTTIIRAQVNYEAVEPVNPTITKTYIQAWSVNG